MGEPVRRSLWQDKPYIILVIPADNRRRGFVLRLNHDHGAKLRFATEVAALQQIEELQYAQRMWQERNRHPMTGVPEVSETYTVILDDRFAEQRGAD